MSSTAPTAPAQPSPSQIARSTKAYPLVVSFGSAYCGTDRQAARALKRLLDDYKPEALGRETGSWLLRSLRRVLKHFQQAF